MVVQITAVDGCSPFVQKLAENSATRQVLRMGGRSWLGMVDNKAICIWGLIPPSIMSDQAYLWLHVTEAFAGHEFLLVRHSQRMVERMLEEFTIIRGHVQIDNDKALRWIKWLGASFGDPVEDRIPFAIRRKGWQTQQLWPVPA